VSSSLPVERKGKKEPPDFPLLSRRMGRWNPSVCSALRGKKKPEQRGCFSPTSGPGREKERGGNQASARSSQKEKERSRGPGDRSNEITEKRKEGRKFGRSFLYSSWEEGKIPPQDYPTFCSGEAKGKNKDTFGVHGVSRKKEGEKR